MIPLQLSATFDNSVIALDAEFDESVIELVGEMDGPTRIITDQGSLIVTDTPEGLSET